MVFTSVPLLYILLVFLDVFPNNFSRDGQAENREHIPSVITTAEVYFHRLSYPSYQGESCTKKRNKEMVMLDFFFLKVMSKAYLQCLRFL